MTNLVLPALPRSPMYNGEIMNTEWQDFFRNLVIRIGGSITYNLEDLNNVILEVLGTTNQITVTDSGGGSFTLSTPQDTHVGASPTFAELTLSGLATNRLLYSNGSKMMATIADLTSWIAGTTNQITVTDDGDGTATLSLPQDINSGAVPEFDGLKLDVTEVIADYTVTEDDTFLIVTESEQGTALDVSPVVGGDDGYCNRTSSFNTNYEYIIIGNVTQEAFIRFPNITIPNGDNILSAYITLTNHTLSDYGTIDMAIHFNDIDNAIAPTNISEFDNLVLTGNVVWPNEIWYANEQYNSPSLAELLQDIVNKGGWSSGNAVMVVINRNGADTGWKYAVSTDYLGGWEPVLHIIHGSHDPEITIPSTMIADSGRPIFVMKDSIATWTINIVTEGSETINGEASISLQNRYDGVMLLPDGTNLQAFFFRTDGIEDGNSLIVDGDPNDNEYAKFTENGLEGRTYAEVRADINVIEDGTAQGQIAFWDGTKWVKTETSELFWDDVNKRLGVGTSLPGSKASLSYADPQADDLLFNIYSEYYGDNVLEIRKHISSGGWFKFISPQSWMGFQSGQTVFSNPDGNVKFQLEPKYNYNGELSAYNGNLVFQTRNGARPISFEINEVEQARIASDGNFGLGTTTPQAKSHVVGTTRLGDQATNYVEIGDTGDVVLVGGAGIPYGEISAQSNTTTTSLTEDVPAQITIFDTNGASNNATPDHTNDHITITKAGHYYVSCSMTVNSSGGTGALVEFEVMKNNGDSRIIPHQDRTFAGGGGESGCLTLTGIADLAATDTIEVWATNEDNDDDIVVEDICLSAFQVGGT